MELHADADIPTIFFLLALLFPISAGIIEREQHTTPVEFYRGCPCRSHLNCKMAEHGAKVQIMAAVFSDGEYKWRY